jgi:hypothetical protein
MAQVAEKFRIAMRVSWVSENITGAGTTFGQPYGDAFDQLDNDQADFAIVAKLGGRGAEIQGSSVHMYMWDRGSKREIDLLVSKHLLAMGAKANRKIDRFINDLRAADSTAVVTNR